MNTLDLKGRSAIITGGARGFGYAIAERMLASGGHVILWDIDAKALDAAAAKLAKAGKVDTAVVELTEESQIASATAAAIKSAGKIDILVNNAGIAGGVGKLWELDPAIWRKVIDVNLIAPYLVCRHVVPHMRSAKYGRIINIASIAGKEGNPNASHYAASKAGIIGMTKSLGKELATENIMVNCITPAAAQTDILKDVSPEFIAFMLSKIPMGRLVKVEELAALACWLASEDCSFTTAGVFDLSGGRATY